MSIVRGYGFLGTLAIMLTGLFVAGQVFGFLSWSWWLVLLPAIIYVGIICIPIALSIAAAAIVFGLIAVFIAAALVFLILYVLFLLGLTIYKDLRRKIRGFRHDRRNRTASKVS